MEWIIEGFFAGLLIGALMGVVPLILGKFLGRPSLGLLGLLCCSCGGALLGAVTAIVVAIVFSVIILAARTDIRTGSAAGQTMQVMCMTGPLQGHVYPICAEGLLLGRDQCCSLRLPGSAVGVSRRHCRLRLQGGSVILEDLQSAYGTYLATGQRLVPNQPVVLVNGSRFYLGDRCNEFQITA